MKTYKINFYGWGAEVIIGSCSEKMYKHFKHNNIDVTDHMCGNMEDELSEEIHEGLTIETKFDNDEFYHQSGPYLNDTVKMCIVDENDVEIFSTPLECTKNSKWSSDCENEIISRDFDSEYVIVGQEICKGFQSEYLLHLEDDEEFDESELILVFDEIDEDYEIVIGVMYGEMVLESTGEVSTIGKTASWYIVETETGEQTETY